jgi:hypothetical protein
MAFSLPSHTPTKIPWKHGPPQISYVLRSHHSLNWRGRSYPRQITHHLPRGCCGTLVFQTPAVMYLLLATAQRKVPSQLLGFPSGARYGRRFSVLHQKRNRNAPQFLPKVLTTEGLSSGSIRQTSHSSGYQGLAHGAFAQSSCQRAAQNSAGAL